MEQSTGNNSSFMPRLTERNALKNSLKLDDEPVHSKKHNFQAPFYQGKQKLKTSVRYETAKPMDQSSNKGAYEEAS